MYCVDLGDRFATICDAQHFLNGCENIEAARIDSLNRYAPRHTAATNLLRHWREIARGLEHRWRERTQKLRHAADAPQNPGDAQDDEHAAEINVVMQQILPNDIRYNGNERQSTLFEPETHDGTGVLMWQFPIR